MYVKIELVLTDNMSIPLFTADGLLPPGDYAVTFDELRLSHLVNGNRNSSPTWDANWRLSLVNNAEILVRQLWISGISEVYLNGSFVQDKDHPKDIDGYFVCDENGFLTGAIHNKLNALDPYKVWEWHPNSRQPHPNSTKKWGELPMWHRYRVEMYPHWSNKESGIKDAFGNELEFPSAFRQQSYTYKQKGIIKIIP